MKNNAPGGDKHCEAMHFKSIRYLFGKIARDLGVTRKIADIKKVKTCHWLDYYLGFREVPVKRMFL